MSRYPAEILRDKYVPLKYIESHLEGVTQEEVHKLIRSSKIRYAEMKEPGGRLRIPHVNPEEIACVLRGEVYELCNID